MTYALAYADWFITSYPCDEGKNAGGMNIRPFGGI